MDPSDPSATDAARSGGENGDLRLIRLGWAPTDAEPLPASPRRPLGDVIEWVR